MDRLNMILFIYYIYIYIWIFGNRGTCLREERNNADKCISVYLLIDKIKCFTLFLTNQRWLNFLANLK